MLRSTDIRTLRTLKSRDWWERRSRYATNTMRAASDPDTAWHLFPQTEKYKKDVIKSAGCRIPDVTRSAGRPNQSLSRVPIVEWMHPSIFHQYPFSMPWTSIAPTFHSKDGYNFWTSASICYEFRRYQGIATSLLDRLCLPLSQTCCKEDNTRNTSLARASHVTSLLHDGPRGIPDIC